jgi:threonine/homoserine/homoserine lactone efflux protein
MTYEFFLTSLIVVASPGTGALYTIAAGLSRGAKASIIAAFGCALGCLPHMAAAITGLAALLHTSALAFQVLKYAGVAYLLWMAFQTLKETGTLQVDTTATPRSAWQVIIQAVLINLLNPKLTIFFFAFLPQFVPASSARTLPLMLELSAIFTVLTFVIFALYGVLAAQMRAHVITRPDVMTWLRRTFAAAFVALGAKLALAER